jgi:hypothetical protein
MDAPEVSLAPARLDEYVGSYSLAGTRTRVISREENRLYARDGDANRLEMVPIGKDLFEVRTSQVRFHFRRQRGRIVAVDMEPRILIGDRATRIKQR